MAINKKTNNDSVGVNNESVGENMEKLESTCTAGRNVKQCNSLGKQSGASLNFKYRVTV